jgi:5-enolpyruvylshikimate-3-phosphate synthase
VTIGGFGTVGSSYPQFLADLESLGGRWEVTDG